MKVLFVAEPMWKISLIPLQLCQNCRITAGISNPKTHALNVISDPFFYIVSSMTFPRDLYENEIYCITQVCVAGTAQSAQRLTTAWTVRGFNSGGVRYFKPMQTGPGDHQTSCKTGSRNISQG